MGTDGVHRDEPEPLWEQLSETLFRQIESGEIPPRRKLPTQAQLVEMYDVSRGTVLRATEALVAAGVARFVPGRGLWTEQPEKIAEWKKERQRAKRKS